MRSLLDALGGGRARGGHVFRERDVLASRRQNRQMVHSVVRRLDSPVAYWAAQSVQDDAGPIHVWNEWEINVPWTGASALLQIVPMPPGDQGHG